MPATPAGRPVFIPTVDTTIFLSSRRSKLSVLSDPYLLFFYGRPENTRNAFELGIAALKRLKQRMNGLGGLLTAGHGWRNAVDYGAQGIVENLELSEYEGDQRTSTENAPWDWR